MLVRIEKTLNVHRNLATQFARDEINPIKQPSLLFNAFIREINQNNVRTLAEFRVIFVDGSEAIFSNDIDLILVYSKTTDTYISWKNGIENGAGNFLSAIKPELLAYGKGYFSEAAMKKAERR